jgi:TRAP-type C4-dicarboxylate transport system substrate-binding protein
MLICATSQAWSQTRWDLASGYPATTFHTENLVQFTKDVDAATQGQLKISVHANSSLFKTNEIKRAVQSGQTQAGEIFLAQYENETPLFALDGVPFLASTYEEARKLYDAQHGALLSYFEKQGMVMLYSVPWQPQGLQSKKTVASMADLRGAKWRANSATTARMGSLAGANPVTILASELSQALATGQIDAMISSSQTAVDSRVYESFGHFYDIQAWLPKNAVLVNAKAFEALPAAQQAAVRQAAAAAEIRGWKVSAERDLESKKTIATKGMTVHTPSPKLAADLKQLGASMLQDWQKKAGADGDAILKSYRASLSAKASLAAKGKP